MFGQCKSPVWRQDDFTPCFRHEYLETVFPLTVCAASALYLLVQIASAARQRRKQNGYDKVADGPNGDYVPPDRSRFLDESTTDEDTDGDSLDEAAMPTLVRTRTQESIIEVDRPRGELLLVLVEEVAVIGQLVIHVLAIVLNFWAAKAHRGQKISEIAQVTVWSYLAVLATTRLFLSSQTKVRFSRLWYHTAFIYCFMWVFNALNFRSELVQPHSKTGVTITSVDFALTSLLAIIALTSRKGNKRVKLEYEGEIEPSKELTASVLSLASFAWVDSLIWKGYKKPTEMEDVWNLPPRDKAANLLAEYRQVKKTASLAFHLLGHFKRSLLIQASWAAISGFMTFAPTLLLKAILEYVEDPGSTPKNAAWFYVILLFVSGCIQGVADGQALWIGRKICIRLRAIIIGEIYAKALKRKVSTPSEKVLGVEKKNNDTQKPGLLKRVMTIGKKKDNKKDAAAGKPLQTENEGQVSSGAIINLMAVDSFKVSEICAYLHFLWASTPVQFIGTIFLLYRILGFSSFVGIATMGLLLPVNMVISKKFASLQKEILAATDARINITNEVLSNIRIIKFFAWEQRFMAMVDEKRKVELRNVMRRYTVWAFAGTVWSGAPVLITFLTFLVYTRVEHKPLVPSVAFTALSLFQILRIPLDQLADMVAHVQESKVSVDRVEEYLNEPETEKFQQLKRQRYDANGDPFIGFESGTFSWGANGDKDTEAFKLLDLNFRFKPGQLNVIVGPTGSGKTSILMALLGEMTLLEGDVFLPGAKSREDLRMDPDTGLIESVAYCAQSAWLVNASIKENIVFASPWNPQRYKDVLVACSLQRDLEIFDAGDETLVGEKGVTLSGGQKQRISLARALYSRARHILLDDVLSAVDAHTSKWIFEQAILGPLMANRTCILVTHSVSMCLPHADFAVVLENGRIAARGTAQEVAKSGKLSDELSASLAVSRAPSRIPSRVPSDVAETSLEDAANAASGTNGAADSSQAKGPAKSGQAPADETKAVGSVKFSIILLYFAAMGSWLFWFAAATVFVAQQLISVGSNLWIRQWANAYAQRGIALQSVSDNKSYTHITGVSACFTGGVCGWTVPFSRPSATISVAAQTDEVDDVYYLTVFAGIGILLAISVFFREIVLFWGSITASKTIHNRLMKSIMHARFRFFDSTPLGQIMNRFSKDIEAIDQEVTPVAVGLIFCLLSILTIVVLISAITPGFLIAGFFISILYFGIGMLYINSSRDLKRLESVKRSPLYQQFGETLSGMTTIRAYGDERRFIRENLNRLNTQSRPFIYLWAANRWLAFRIDIVGSLVSFFSGAFVLMSVGRIDAGAAGLAMTYAVTYTENMLWFVRLYASNEQNMNSVERIKEYLDVEQEAPPIIEDKRPPGSWPKEGSVEFVDYSTRYRQDFDKVLKKVSFKVLPGEKVGVVGRTGAGKSSMALALFRALEAEEGKILVDGIDIGEIGLQDLRENIVMVPQDPTLFTGTIRSNLDPFGLFTDEEILTALRKVQLIGSPGPSTTSTPNRPLTPASVKGNTSVSSPSDAHASDGSQAATASDTVGTTGTASSAATLLADDTFLQTPLPVENKNIFLNLSSPISESGSNLSQGQRQLLCLARALLKEPAVLLMDEATASIDHATDSKIQHTIRRLRNTTITIAHRLKTIVDYDKVLVLERGEVAEFGTPWDLIKEESGMFRGMCEGSGELDVLLDMAEKARREKEAGGT